MLKRLLIALAFAGLLSPAYSAGTLPGFSVSQQMDKFGKPLAGCKLFIIQAGTIATPQNAYFDSGLTLPTPNPLICDAAGRISQFFLADGSIKVRLTDVNNVQILTADGLLVVGPSGGGGGGGGVDPTTILATGDLKVTYGVGVLSGFVRANGRTIGSATSGATERANSDTSALFAFLWSADPNLAVSGGRGVSAAADFAANKTIVLPDWRGRAIAGLDDMGNSAAGRLTASYFGSACGGSDAITLGHACGGESQTLTLAQLPTNITSANASQAITVYPAGNPTSAWGPYVASASITGGNNTLAPNSGGGYAPTFPTASWSFTQSYSANNSIGVTSNNTSGAAHPNVPPTMLATIYLKL